MATTYDKASLVMIPSGYKDDKLYSIKPTDGSGDFTFSRDGAGASPATRVNASGLIEKGRTNELTYSNDFSNAAWVKLGAGTATATSVTSGFSDPDGGSNAWRLQCDLNGGTTSSDQSLIYQLASGGGLYTYSFYVKSNTGATQNFAFGNDLNGYDTAVATTSWQRFEVFVNSSSSHNAFIGSRGTTGSDDTLDILIYAAQVEQGLVATDYIATTTSPVSAGLLGDMPRLDYSGGATCPSLLLEPSRVNSLPYSEYPSAWDVKSNISIQSNEGTSPEGVVNASNIYPTATGASFLYQTLVYTSGNAYTYSVFAKANGKDYLQIATSGASWASNVWCTFDLALGATDNNGFESVGIEDYGNGWYRCYVKETSISTSSSRMVIGLVSNANAGRLSSVTANGTDGVLVYGVVSESGSYPTSYIPTYGSASTRGGDDCSLTSASAIIGQSEGVIYLEVDQPYTNGVQGAWSISDGSSSNRITMNTTDDTATNFVFSVATNYAGSGTSLVSADANYIGTHKVAIKYSGTTIKLFVDGALSDSTTTTGFGNFNQFHLGSNQTGAASNEQRIIKQSLLFTSALTDAECIALTTI